MESLESMISEPNMINPFAFSTVGNLLRYYVSGVGYFLNQRLKGIIGGSGLLEQICMRFEEITEVALRS